MTKPQTENPPVRKRRTVNPSHQACAACKARKVRCDSARPKCSACATNGKACEYPPVYRRATCSKQYVDELEAKLRNYERLKIASQDEQQKAGALMPIFDADTTLPADGTNKESALPSTDVHLLRQSPVPARAVTDGFDTTTNAPLTSEVSPFAPTKIIDDNRQTASSSQPYQDKPSQPQSSENQVSDEEYFEISGSTTPVMDDDDEDGDASVIDGIAEYPRSSPGSKGGEHFGESSTFNFALAMAASKDTKAKKREDPRLFSLHHEDVYARTNGAGYAVSVPPYFDHLEKERHSFDEEMTTALRSYLDQSSLQYLPQRHAASKLLQKYFTDVHPIWPFLIEQDTKVYFDKTWTSDEAPNPVWIAQLNLVFALACQFYEANDLAPLPNTHEAGRQFYLRASGYVVANTHRRCSIPLLQALLLAAEYQQGTMRSDECWLTIGNATRMALGLGLHETMDDAVPPLERELCKRLWWGCFALDSCNFPSLVDDSFIATGHAQPDDQPAINAFFCSVAKLYHLMDEMLDNLQDDSRMVRRPRAWPRNTSQKWPPLFSGISGEKSSVNQCNVNLENKESSFIEGQLARLSATICVQMAQLQIGTVDAGRKLRVSGAWWWDLHFTFNSLCVLFAALGVPKADMNAICPDLAETKSTIRRGFRNTHEMVMRGGPKVAQSEKFLMVLLKTMTRRGDKFHPQQDDPNKESSSFVQSSSSEKTTLRRDADMTRADNTDYIGSKSEQLGADLQGAAISNDAGFLDAFDFLMADQTSSLWPGTDTIMDWENRVPHSDGDSISSFLHSYDMSYPGGIPLSPTFAPS
ncbi:hypothetical protein G7046_g9044 [Stylonectria norvegica]|nr:hypothetical protein G7046_g9044 [Stylonectria norvegica]